MEYNSYGLVIGNTVEAAMFAYLYNYPLVINSLNTYQWFDYIYSNVKYEQEYNKLIYCCKQIGLCKFDTEQKEIRFIADDEIEVKYLGFYNGFSDTYKFEKCFIFNDQNVKDIEIEIPGLVAKNKYKRVYKFIHEFGTGYQDQVFHPTNTTIWTFKDFKPRKIIFPSYDEWQRKKSSHQPRMISVVSFYNDKDLDDIDIEDGPRDKVLEFFNDIVGVKYSISRHSSGYTKSTKAVLVLAQRYMYPIMPEYKDTERFIFMNKAGLDIAIRKLFYDFIATSLEDKVVLYLGLSRGDMYGIISNNNRKEMLNVSNRVVQSRNRGNVVWRTLQENSTGVDTIGPPESKQEDIFPTNPPII